MAKHVVVIVSGEKDRRALPHLVAHLETEGISVDEVRIPPRNRALNVEMAEKLVKATWFQRIADPPDKIVLLVDVDTSESREVLRPFQEELPKRLGPRIRATIQYACAKWHLEAWYFADAAGLRAYLGRDLGSIDSSRPDEICDPKLQLMQLLGDQAYTAVISEEIAKSLNAETIGQRSPSFLGFIESIRNGGVTPHNERTVRRIRMSDQ